MAEVANTVNAQAAPMSGAATVKGSAAAGAMSANACEGAKSAENDKSTTGWGLTTRAIAGIILRSVGCRVDECWGSRRETGRENEDERKGHPRLDEGSLFEVC